MIKASYDDKKRIVDILRQSFDTNKSVNYIIPQDSKREKRIAALMDYSFELCYHFGEVFLSDDKKACALIMLPERKKTTLKAILLDAKMVISCTGLKYVKKALDREAKVKALLPQEAIYYLWFIGVDPAHAHQGIGSNLLKEVIAAGDAMGRPVCLETSTERNIPWYQHHGFHIYNELTLSYKLSFLRREPSK